MERTGDDNVIAIDDWVRAHDDRMTSPEYVAVVLDAWIRDDTPLLMVMMTADGPRIGWARAPKEVFYDLCKIAEDAGMWMHVRHYGDETVHEYVQRRNLERIRFREERVAEKEQYEREHPFVCTCKQRFKTERGWKMHMNRSRRHAKD